VQRTAWSPGQRLLSAGLIFMVTAVAFEGLAVPTILPATLDDLGGLVLYGWAFSGYSLSNLIGIALAGVEADRRGPLTPFVAGTVCFAVGLVVAGLAPSMGWVVAGRAIQGLGGGAIGAIMYVAISRGYDTSAQPRMIAIVSSAWVLPGLLGPALAGYVTEAASWRWTFLGLAPLLPVAAFALAGPLARLRIDERMSARARPAGTVLDAVLLAVGASAVLGALSAPSVFAAVPAVAGAVLAQRSLKRLLPPGSLTARPGRGAATAVLGLLSLSFFGAEAFARGSRHGSHPVGHGAA
jgi:MFS family permease